MAGAGLSCESVGGVAGVGFGSGLQDHRVYIVAVVEISWSWRWMGWLWLLWRLVDIDRGKRRIANQNDTDRKEGKAKWLE